MASESYQVKVLSIQDKQVRLEFQIISPDEYYFYDKKNFALQILWDAAQQNEDAKIIKAISQDQILDSDWVMKHADDFIASVQVVETKEYPEKKELEKLNREGFDDFRKKHGTPTATYEIIVTSVDWLAHLEPDKTWKSAAYDLDN